MAMPQPSRRRSPENLYHRYHFTYDQESGSYICTQGQRVRLSGVQRSGKGIARRYRGSAPICRPCPAFGVCTKDGLRGRALIVSTYDDALYRHRAWMSTDEARDIYKLRKQLVEPVFGIVKEQQGARQDDCKVFSNPLVVSLSNQQRIPSARPSTSSGPMVWVLKGLCNRPGEPGRAIAYEIFWLAVGSIDILRRRFLAHLPSHREILAADHPKICC